MVYIYTIIIKHCSEKFKILSNWKDIPINGLEHSLLLTCQFPAISPRFKVILMKILAGFYFVITDSNIYMKCRGYRNESLTLT